MIMQNEMCELVKDTLRKEREEFNIFYIKVIDTQAYTHIDA